MVHQFYPSLISNCCSSAQTLLGPSTTKRITAHHRTLALTLPLVTLLHWSPPAEASIPLSSPGPTSHRIASTNQVRALEQLGFKSKQSALAVPEAPPVADTRIQIQNVMSLMNQASEAGDTGDWETALRCYDEIIKTYPDFALAERARVSKSLVLFQLDRKDEAVLQMEDEEVALRGAPEVHAALAAMTYDAGRVSQAEQQWDIATEFDTRYKDPEWVSTEKKWPPKMILALKKFLSLSIIPPRISYDEHGALQ